MSKKATETTETTETKVKKNDTGSPKITVDFEYPKECKIQRMSDTYLQSNKYKAYRDIMLAVLDVSKLYTESEVVELIEEYLNKGVK